jgi:hypothetical protein
LVVSVLQHHVELCSGGGGGPHLSGEPIEPTLVWLATVAVHAAGCVRFVMQTRKNEYALTNVMWRSNLVCTI